MSTKEVTRLRDVVRKLESAAASAADQGIGLFLEFRDVHGYDEEVARAKAVSEVIDGTQAINDISQYETEEQRDSAAPAADEDA